MAVCKMPMRIAVGEPHGPVTITIMDYASGYGGNANYCYVTINGTKYYQPTTLTVPYGTIISMTVVGNSSCQIKDNGNLVVNGAGATYDYAAVGDVEIKLRYSYGCYIEFTTTESGSGGGSAASPHLTINFASGVNSTSYAYARVPSTSTSNIAYNSTKYDADIAKGTKFLVYVSGSSSYRSQCKITLNGTQVKTGYGNGYFTINSGNVTVTFSKATSNYYTCAVVGDCTYSSS